MFAQRLTVRSITVIVGLILVGLVGLLLVSGSASAVSVDDVSGPSEDIYAPEDEIEFTFEFSMEATESNPRCAFTYNGSAIDVSLDPGCESGQTITATTTDIGSPGDVTLDAAIVVTVEVDTLTGSTTDNGQTSKFSVDGLNPNPAIDNANLDAPSVLLLRENLLNGEGRLGPGPFDVNVDNPDHTLADAQFVQRTDTCSQMTNGYTDTVTDVGDRKDLITFPSITASDLGVDGQDVAIAFQIFYTDEAGNTARSPSQTSCFRAFIDTQPPSLDVPTNPLTHQNGTPNLVFDEALTTSDQATHNLAFSTSDPHNETVTLSWSGAASGLDEATEADGSRTVTFPSNTTAPGNYTLTLESTDDLGNSQTQVFPGLKVDAQGPRLLSITFDDTGGCDPFQVDLTASGPTGTYCEGPWDVTVETKEHFPKAAPTFDDLTGFPNGFGTLDGHSRAADGTHQYHFNDVAWDGENGTVGFDITYEEEDAFDDREVTRDDRGFSIAGAPQVNFDPPQQVFEGTAEFTLTNATTSDGDCPATLAAMEFCAPGSGSLSIELVEAGTRSHIADFTGPNQDDEWTVSTNLGAAAGSGAVRDVTVLITEGSLTGVGQPQTITVDRADPAVSYKPEIFVFSRQDANSGPDTLNTRWKNTTESNSNEIPTQGYQLIGLPFSSFSADQIVFRYTETGNDPRSIDYTFNLNDAGTGSSDSSDRRAVHLATQMRVETDVNGSMGLQELPGQPFNLTPSDGCSSPGTDATLLRGQGRFCYFLVVLDNPTSTSDGSSTGVEDSTDYEIEVILREPSMNSDENPASFDFPSDDGDLELRALEPDVDSFSAVSLSSNPPEAGTTTEFSFEVDGSSLDFVDTWACLMRPSGTGGQPFGGFAGWTGASRAWDEEPDCEVDEFPNPDRASGHTFIRAMNMSIDQDADSPEQERTASPRITTQEFARTDEDQTYFVRVWARDDVGNFLSSDFQSQGPGTFKVANYDVSQRPRLLNQDSPDTTDFRDNPRRCFQPPSPVAAGATPLGPAGSSSDNDEDNPCIRRIDLSRSGGSYGSIAFDVILRNLGNVEDSIDVSWDHEAGQIDWSVELVDPQGSTSTDSLTIGPIGDGDTHTIRVRMTPNDEAVAGEFKTVDLEIESSNAQNPEVRHLYLRGFLSPLREASLVMGDSAPDDEVTVNTTSGGDVTATATLTNIGNADEPFKILLDGARSTDTDDGSELCRFEADSTADDEDHIVIRPEDERGLPISGSTEFGAEIDPGEAEAITFEVDVGDRVVGSGASPYRCVFDVASVDENDVIQQVDRLTPTDPTLLVEVTGESDIRILELSPQEQNEVDVTGETIQETVPPDESSHTITLFLENNGSVSLEPELTITPTEGSNPLSLSYQWNGIDADGNRISRSQATSAFPLTVTDSDDPAEIRDELPFTGQSGQWSCMENVDDDNDGEDRNVCRVDLVLDVTSATAVAGDRLTFDLTWEDNSQAGSPASTTLDLRFDHVGAVRATSVDDHVLGTQNSPTTVTFQADLIEGRSFDLFNQQQVRGTLSVSTADGPCGDVGDDIRSTSENASSATFDVSVDVEIDSSSGCQVSSSASPVTVTVPDTTTVDLRLVVQDDEGATLRQVHPASIDVVSGSVTTPQPATDHGIAPNQTMNANGTQFVRYSFDTPDNNGLDGVLLSRKSQVDALEPFVRCALDPDAGHRTSDLRPGATPALEWRRISAPTDTSQPQIPITPNSAGESSRPGQILEERRTTGDDTADVRGRVDIYTWAEDGDTQPAWREGWNPLVLYITDEGGDPARPADAQSGVSPDIEFRMVVNGTNGVEHTYELDSQDDVIHVRSLGGGYYAVDLYIPDGWSGLTGLENHWEDRGEPSYRDWALQVDIPSGESRAGDDLRGEAHWTLADLGIADANGISQIRNVTRTVELTTTEEATRTGGTFERSHVATRFQYGGLPWVTGYGPQSFQLFAMEEDVSREQRFRDSDDVRRHTFRASTDLSTRAAYQPASRTKAAGGSIPLSEADDTGRPGLYTGVLNLKDLGVPTFGWNIQAFVRDSGSTIHDPFFTLETREDREPASSGLPMPLCLEPPKNAPSDENTGVFTEDALSGLTTVDLRAVPGLLADSGTFSMTPFVTENTDGTGGIEHQIAPDATFTVRGEGLVTLEPIAVPTTGEVDTPLTIAVRAIGPVEDVTATLSKGDIKRGPTQLTLVEGSTTEYRGTIRPNETGTWSLVIEATDPQEGVSEIRETVDVEENLLPRISITSPGEVDGTRAISPSGSIDAAINDRSVTAASDDAITVERKTGGADGGPDGSPLETDNVTIDGVLDEDTVGNKSLTVTFPNQSDGTAYLNVTSGDAVDGINGSTISDNTTTGWLDLKSTGTVEIRIQTNGTNAVDANFTIKVVEDTSGSGSYETVPSSELSTNCASGSCNLTYTPSGLSDGDSLTFRISVDLGGGDANSTGDVTVQVDGTDPTASITIDGPKASGTPTLVGSSTLVTISGDDDTGLESLTLRAVQDGTETGSTTITGGSGEATLSNLGLTNDGTATLELTARDVAGNTGEDTVEVQIDTTSPQVNNPDLQASGSSLAVTVTAEDEAGIGEVLLFFKKPTEDRFTSKTMTEATGDTYEASINSPGSSGTLEYYFQATDRLGNQASRGDQNNPLTFNLGDVELENSPPTVSITSPQDGASVSGEIELVLDISDPDGDDVSISSATIDPSSGSSVSLDASGDQASIPLDTTQLAEGRAIVEIEASDGMDTSTASLQLIVNNLPDAGACETDQTLETGSDVEVCFEFPTSENVTDLEVELIRNGETISTSSLSPDTSGQYQTTFDIEEEGSYALRITATHEDGSTEETTSEPFQVQSGGGVTDSPIGRFVTVLVLGVVVVGLAAFAAFGRWD